MPFDTISDGLTIKVPTLRTKGWNTVIFNDNFKKISGHDHSGSGNGTPIPTDGIAGNAVDDRKIRLRNNQWLRARNAAGTGDINILRVAADDSVELNVSLSPTLGYVFTNEPGAAPVGLTAGKTYFQPNYVISLAINYTVVAGAYMEILGFLQVDGTLTVNGQVRVT